MSVLSFLTSTASNAVLSVTETSSINTSINTLNSRLTSYFQDQSITLRDKFKFGSSTRDTILPRHMDEHSDIDYMIVFDSGYQPQTYLDRLSRFANFWYSSSEIYQSSPTIVLNLNHIKFELVPAIRTYSWSTNDYQIPNGSNWMNTNPNDFNQQLITKNQAHSYLIKPTIRLVKYWNAKSGYPFQSYLLEKWICGLTFYPCLFGNCNQKDYFFSVFDSLNEEWNDPLWKKEEIQRAKRIIKNVRFYEDNNCPVSAEDELKKLFRL
jgi:hypothetical protein